MKRTQLTNKGNKMEDPKDILKYKKQRNYVVKLSNQSKQEYFDNLLIPYQFNLFLPFKASLEEL